MEKIKYLVSGDCTVCVEFGNEISPEINRRIRAFKIALEKEAVDGVVETIPTYRSLSGGVQAGGDPVRGTDKEV